MTEGKRVWAARRLFGEWTGVTNLELLGALWNNLEPDDREVWLRRADEQAGDQ